MSLDKRLKEIERVLKARIHTVTEPQYFDLRELPKETWIEALSIIKSAGGYQFMFRPEEVEKWSEEEIRELNQLTPEEFYFLMIGKKE